MKTFPNEADLNNLPIEIAYGIWDQVIRENQFTYEKTAELAKSFTTLNKFLQTDHHYPQIWYQFWTLAFGRIGWDQWMQLDEETGAPWANSWKSFFFWCLLIERACSRILLESIVDQAYARAKFEFKEPDLFFDVQGWQGPIKLVRRQKPIIPKRWKYLEGHLVDTGIDQYTFVWPDGSEQIFSVGELFDEIIRPDVGTIVPIYMSHWVYLTFNGEITSDAFEGIYPGIPDLHLVYEAFVRSAFQTRTPNDPYFVKISDRDQFPLNPLVQLNRIKDLLVARPGPPKPLDVPRYYDEGQVYLGAFASGKCTQCHQNDAKLMDPSIQKIFCGIDCQRKYYVIV